MRSSRPDPWAQVGLIVAIAAMVGAGVGVSGALFFAERRLSGVEPTLDSIDARLARLEAGLRDRSSPT
jgi:hypothetical protein